MKDVKRCAAAICLALLAASGGAQAIKVSTGNDDLVLNINVLLQARAQGDFNGPPSTAALGQSPAGNFNTDFYVRRARLSANGSAYKYFTYGILFDTPNFGVRGNYSTGLAASTFVQELVVGFQPDPDFVIEAGFLDMLLSHVQLARSSSTSIMEGPAFAFALLNNARGNRMTGVQFRSMLFDHRIHLRGGIYEGLRFSTPPPGYTGPVVNQRGVPLFGAMARYNFVGDEPSAGYPGIYLDGKSRVSVGAGVQYQSNGALIPDVKGVQQGVADYVALSTDAFIDLALPGDQEAVAQLVGYRFDNGKNAAGDGSSKTGYGAHGDIGYRIGRIQPQANAYWFNSDTKQNSYLKVGGGVNYYLHGHDAKVMTELARVINNGNLSTTPGLYQIIVQGQVSF